VIADLPWGIIEIQTRDINNDGTDEVFCIYEDMVIICELQDNVSIDVAEISLPYFYLENYPNPFNTQTTIRFILPEPQNVQLIIYDLLGRQVQMLIDGYLQAGSHSINFDASGLSSGVYFYRLQAGKTVETKRMVLLK
jgi:hypothetical protein